jgi:hypothetical protein
MTLITDFLSGKRCGRVAVLIVLSALVFALVTIPGCGRRQDPAKHPPVSYDENAGSITIPNATIITGGNEYSETASLNSTGLALVVTEDSSLYFYSTALGDVDALDIEHSVKAIGKFLLANAGTQPQSLDGVDTVLSSGIGLRSVSGNRVECANTLHRWAAVKVNPGGGMALLTPRSCFKIGLLDLLEGDVNNIFQVNRIPRDTVANGEQYETYGAVARAFLCTFSAPLLTMQGEAIEAGFSSDADAFTWLQVLDGCDLVWLVVDAVSPVGAGKLSEVIGKTLFKAGVKASVQGVIADEVARGSAPNIMMDVIGRGIVDEIVNDFVVGLLGGAMQPEAGDSRLRHERPVCASRTVLAQTQAARHDVKAAVEPVTICLLVLKAIKVAVAGTNFLWGAFDAATHDAYAEYTDPTAVKPYTVALTWGEYPRDLDAHCWTPDIGGSSHHVYYSNKGWLEGTPYCELDVDDTYSYGPERISIGTAFPGEYTYAVNQYSSDSTLSGSSARVNLYVQGHLSRTFTVPTGPANGRDWWHVFRLNGSTGAVTVLNTLEHDPPFPYGGLRAKQ